MRTRLRKAAMPPREEEPAVMLGGGDAIVPVESVTLPPVGVQSMPQIPELPSLQPPVPVPAVEPQQQPQARASLFRQMKYPAAANRSAVRRI